MLQNEKQKNKQKIFECHQVPVEIKKDLNIFLNLLKSNDTFLFELQNNIPEIKTFEINFLDEENIQKLNKQYRQIDNPTDVLSFNLTYTGEIDLCEKIIRDNANNFHIDFLEETFRCIIHGCLHIAGHDHTEKLNPKSPASIKHSIKPEPMFLIQEEILKNVTSSSLPQV